MEKSNTGKVILYQTEDGQTKLEVQFKDETVWLSLDQMAELFQRDKSTISRHIKNVYEDGELNTDSTVAPASATSVHQKRCFIERYSRFMQRA